MGGSDLGYESFILTFKHLNLNIFIDGIKF